MTLPRRASLENGVGDCDVTALLISRLSTSFRFWYFSDAGTFDEINEAAEAAPQNCRSWWRIRGANKIAPEPRGCPDIKIEIPRTLFVFVPTSRA
jgi:hypothetical protein